MKRINGSVTTIVLDLACVGVLLTCGRADAQEIRVMTSGAFTAAFNELTPVFEGATGNRIVTVYGGSMGGAPGTIPNRLQRGEPADVVIMAASALDDLITQGKVVAGSRVDLVRSTIGAAVRAGASKPDISSVDALKRTLLAAKSIAYSSSASGVYLSTELFPRLGIADQIASKSSRVESDPVGEVVARGDAELGFQQISELRPVKGIDIVGPLPADAQRVTIFSAGISATAKQPAAARRLVAFLSSPAAAAVIAKSGLDPIAQLPAVTASCADLMSTVLRNTTIMSAKIVEAGAFIPPGPAGAPASTTVPAAFKDVPAFCRVTAMLAPSSDSDIKIEVWLPASGWNGKFEAVGNGGWAGGISYAPAMAAALRGGYATASTDTGHAGTAGDGSFAFNHPEKVIDFGYRAVHEMTTMAKLIVGRFYGNPPRLSYWNGCSTGGRQGLMEAQRYPADYDGIIAGAPANYMTHLSTQSLWAGLATLKDPASFIPREKYAVIHKAALDACDALDGVKDGLIDNPARCHFDPKTTQCSGADAPTCLTAPQVEAAGRIYAPVRNPRTGAEIFPGMAFGSELGWAALTGGPKPLSISEDYFKYILFKNPDWDFKTIDFDKDVALADRTDAGIINAIDPNLSAFFGRGGKLLMYHGWADQLIAPGNSINYYENVAKALGRANKIDDSMRLFMAPGMAHCFGGDGPNSFDSVTAIEQWVEQKIAPAQIRAAHMTNGVVDRTRPLCPYPMIAAYKGSGSTNDAASFVCRAP